jgi:DNA-binding transcriptional MerR regulator
MSDEDTRVWRIGEPAAASGLSVRALRHYDELALLVPAERTASGYRQYSAAEVQRLYRITALRRLGLGLEAIAAALDGDTADLATVIRRQREAAVVRELAELFGTLREARSAGVDPEDRLSISCARTRALIGLFTGGESDIAASLGRMWSSEDPAALSRGAIDPELLAYSRQVFGAGDGVR